MSSSSDGEAAMEIVGEDNENWKKARTRKLKRKKTEHYSNEEISKIIMGNTQSHSNQTKTTKINTDKNINTKHQSTQKATNKNYSPLMNGIIHKKYKHMFHLSAEANCTRMQFTDLWAKLFPHARDEIIKTKAGFLLKTDTDENEILLVLDKLISMSKIQSYKEASPNRKTPTASAGPSYSVVIGSVEQEIADTVISEHLNKLNLEHRYCKRITSAATNKPTTLIRIITGTQSTCETLLKDGLFFKYRHYPVYTSKPPPPTPKPCSKCLAFTHTTEMCNAPMKCAKCFGNHALYKCTSTLPPKCTSCNSEEHQAWSHKCPNRPTAPIQGIPNVKIKSLNKKSHEISDNKKKSRIHGPVTIHDTIINTYINELNNTTNNDREDLIIKLRKRFIDNFNLDTTAIFSGNRVYILIFELDVENAISPTEPINDTNNIQYEHVRH